MSRILLVDDEANILKVLSMVLERGGYETVCVSSAEEALKKLDETDIDMMISDIRLGTGMDGLELLREARSARPGLMVIMITAYGTVDVAVEAMKEGAFDFVTKPFKLDAFLETVKNAFRHREIGVETVQNAELTEEEGEVTLHFGRIVGESQAMHNVYQMIERVGKTDATVVIQGESGTGKELVAQSIHFCSARRDHPWVPLNCAALPANLLESEMFGHGAGAFTGATKSRDGLFIAANEGTIFLDEVGAMDLSIQGKLLRALQERKVRRVGENRDIPIDVRVIAATNEPLEVKRDAGEFREDLYYRLNVIPINLPPLRRRMEDIPLLARFFCQQQAKNLNMPLRFAENVLDALMSYGWPGNVRELQNAIACAAAMCQEGVIQPGDLPPHIANSSGTAELPVEEAADGKSLQEYLKEKEKQYMERILRKTDGNRTKAAEMLGISRATLYRKLPEE